MQKKRVEILVPLYNDAHRIERFVQEVVRINTTTKKNVSLSILFINDGSSDNPHSVIKGLKTKIPISMIELSRNFGKEAAITAGLDNFQGDGVVLIDVDLQDPIELVDSLISVWLKEKHDVVLAKRSSVAGENNSRRKFSRLYLKIFKRLSGLKIENNVGETRLLSAKAVRAFVSLRENQRFVRGIFSWIGFNHGLVVFDRQESTEKSRFTRGKLLKLALDGIFSFSLAPIRTITLLGLSFTFLTLIAIIAIVTLRAKGVITLPGYTSTLIVIVMTSAIQLTSIGIIGEYLGRTFLEAKRRPIYVIADFHKYSRNLSQR